MLEVHTITKLNRHVYTAELDEFFKLRHNIYSEYLGWRPVSQTNREVDQFDTDHAVYFVGMKYGKVVAGSRLISTVHPHLLSEVFPHLCKNGRPWRRPFVAEWTRGFIVPEERRASDLLLLSQSCAAIMEYCLNEKITHVGGIQKTNWFNLWKRLGWNVIEIGDATSVDGDIVVPAYIEVSNDALSKARKFGKLQTSNLVHQAPYMQFNGLGELDAVS